ncbi:GNAT family N-acetyltransferase [Kribbella sp. NPDC054772]
MNLEVRLRPLTADDAATVAGWGDDEQFCRAADWTIALGLDERLAFHRRLIAQPPSDLRRLGAEVAGSLAGYVDLHGKGAERLELGFVIGERRLWGRGIGTAAAAAGLSYGFGTLGLSEIWAEALDANRGSVTILRRLGMTETGTGAGGEYMGQGSFYRQFLITADQFATRRA